MVGNVNQIVESMFAADNIRNRQSTVGGKTNNFSGYLDSALLNYRTGLLTGGLNSGYSYLNALTGSSWQTLVLEALRDELKKKESDQAEKTEQDSKDAKSQASVKKKPDWAKIRVIEHYKSPGEEELIRQKGILI